MLTENSGISPKDFYKKYAPAINNQQKVFTIIQLFSVVIFAAIMATTTSLQAYYETAIFGLILVLIVVSTSLILQNKRHSFNIQLGVSSFLIVFIYFGGMVDAALLAAQFIILHAVINVLYIGIYNLVKTQSKMKIL